MSHGVELKSNPNVAGFSVTFGPLFSLWMFFSNRPRLPPLGAVDCLSTLVVSAVLSMCEPAGQRHGSSC